jgi:hypothetical protein
MWVYYLTYTINRFYVLVTQPTASPLRVQSSQPEREPGPGKRG